MMGTRFARRCFLAVPALLGLLLAGCATGRLDATKPVGQEARDIDFLMRLSGWMAVGVGIFVAAAVFAIIVKFRAKPTDDPDDLPPQVHGNRKAELTWTIIPTALLVFLTIFTLPTVFDLARVNAAEDARTIRVEGQQWWWQFSYDLNKDGRYDIVTANDLVIPTGEKVNLEIESNDVIHSFWIPQLNGKKDAVPGRVHDWTIRSDEPGIFYGECAEFCGLSHANMQMRTIVLTPDDFERWVEEQLEGKAAAQAAPAEGSAEAAGAALFETHCISCHVVDGPYESAAGGNANLLAGIAPNLTNLMSRTAFAGALYETYQIGPDGEYLRNPDGSLKLNLAELREWVRNAPDMKPARADNQQGMLDFSEVLTDQDLDNLMAYLQTLGSEPVLPATNAGAG
ncbi:MAG: cytochrome c oxidase subunit II [Acidimicrobiales bacterium]|nr:cytochrome c oxidase subunit II [Acidimicrobiales bacterium]MYI07891.1 cytochrome c oxidase subunit II [Acidimicrobiales bacterium]MYK72436.1 cytochrome c oxidase subunit II [Acidimicrobiales bacterium]